MEIRPARFASALETEYLESRIGAAWTVARAGMVFGGLLFVALGAWDELIDRGSLSATWPLRLGSATAFLVLFTVTRRTKSVRALHVAFPVAFVFATVGFGLIVAEIDNGYIAGVPGFIVGMALISVAPITHFGTLSSLAVLTLAPIAVFAVSGATGVEIANVALWIFSGAGFAYISWRVTDAARRRVFRVERALAEERDKVDELIRKMVPTVIANRLKDGETSISDRHDEVTVLFADIAGFTRFSESHGPEEVVGLLNALFSRFDSLVQEHRLEKIKTLGDGYMVAGGAPLPRPDHATAVTLLAVAMRTAVAEFRDEQGVDWQVRIGIHTGPVVAGVIGTDRYAYDMWGDTVNVASRLESTGDTGEIHLSADTAKHLDGAFSLEDLGPVVMKNREAVTAFRLLTDTD